MHSGQKLFHLRGNGQAPADTKRGNGTAASCAAPCWKSPPTPIGVVPSGGTLSGKLGNQSLRHRPLPGELEEEASRWEVTLKIRGEALLTQLGRLEPLAQAGRELPPPCVGRWREALVLQHPALTGTLAQSGGFLSLPGTPTLPGRAGKRHRPAGPALSPRGNPQPHPSNRHFKL